MAFYLLQENGDKIILEQGGGYLILEDTSVPTIVIHGGDDAPRKRKRKPQTTYRDLFREIEQTIHQLMDPPSEAVEPVLESPPAEQHEALTEALDELVELAQGQHALLQQAAALRADLNALAEVRRRFIEEDEADWEWFL